MKFILFSIILFISGFMYAETIDFFKFENNISSGKLYFKSHSDPEIIENGKNFTVLFKDSYFSDEKSTFSRDSSLLMKKLTIKNYEGKGGALNILGKKNFNFEIVRIAPDVVTVKLISHITPAKDSNKIKITSADISDKKILSTKKTDTETKEPSVIKDEKLADKEEKAVTEKKDKETELNALIASVSENKNNEIKSEPVSETPLYFILIITTLIAVFFFFINKKRKAGKPNIRNGKIMNIVETIQVGLKEKLLLVKVGENYVMLFATDKDMKPMGTFSKETVGSFNTSENIQPKEFKAVEARPQLKENIGSFQKKISSILSETNEKRSIASAEEELYATLGRLRKIAVK